MTNENKITFIFKLINLVFKMNILVVLFLFNHFKRNHILQLQLV